MRLSIPLIGFFALVTLGACASENREMQTSTPPVNTPMSPSASDSSVTSPQAPTGDPQSERNTPTVP